MKPTWKMRVKVLLISVAIVGCLYGSMWAIATLAHEVRSSCECPAQVIITVEPVDEW